MRVMEHSAGPEVQTVKKAMRITTAMNHTEDLMLSHTGGWSLTCMSDCLMALNITSVGRKVEMERVAQQRSGRGMTD